MKHLSYANVASTLALVVALSGSAYAVTQLPAKSVGTPQLKDGAVTSKKVKNGGLRAEDLAPGSGLAPGNGVRVTNKGLAPCSENIVLTRTVRPKVRSRLLGISAGYWHAGQGPGYDYNIDSGLQLRESGLIVGRTAKLNNRSVGNATLADVERQPLGTSGVLLDADGAPSVLRPGRTYTLELVAHTYGDPCANNPLVVSAQLSYVVLADHS